MNIGKSIKVSVVDSVYSMWLSLHALTFKTVAEHCVGSDVQNHIQNPLRTFVTRNSNLMVRTVKNILIWY